MRKQIKLKSFESKGVAMSTKKYTIPDQSLSVQEIIRGHSRSYENSVFDEYGTMDRFNRLNKRDRVTFERDNFEVLKRSKNELDNEKSRLRKELEDKQLEEYKTAMEFYQNNKKKD